MFAFNEKCPPREYTNLDACLNHSHETECFSIAKLIKGHRPTKRARTECLKPLTIVRFNSKLGKGKPVELLALLDSGGAGTLVTQKAASKLRLKKSNLNPTRWTTPAGDVTTRTSCKSQLQLAEFHPDRIIEWDFHVAESLGNYDMIIGRDMLQFLKMDIKFSTETVEWDGAEIPFKDLDADSSCFHVDDPVHIQEAHERLKKILDAKYEAADLEEIALQQDELSPQEQQQLLQLLRKYEHLFDGSLGKWNGTKVSLDLVDGAQPYHAKAFPIPKIHMDTLKLEVERLCQLGVLKRVNRSQWAAPTFVIPKKDGSVRFISDFRELNKRIKRRPYPIPNIQDMLLNLEGFRYATSLDLNMGYYHLELDDKAKELCTIVLPFGKFEYQRTPMGLCNSPDIFQEKMNELFMGLDFARAYIDDLLCMTKGTFEDHLEKLERILVRLSQAGLKVNAKKSFFGRSALEYLGYWITRDGIKPMKNKVEAMMNIAEPKTRKELRSFIGVVNYYRDMWFRRSHILAPLAALTSKTVKWEWGAKQKAAFLMAKRVIAKEAILAYPDFSKPFVIHTDASHYQLGGVISQDGKPIAFYSRKLNDAQTRYTTTERELLSIVETLKAHRNILLGHEIVVHTDHKNLVYKTFNTERVMRWRLLIEEFGPELRYIKGELNIVADVLSRLNIKEEEFSMDAFAFDDEDFPESYPLSYKEIAFQQKKDSELQQLLRDGKAKTQQRDHSSHTYDLIVNNENKILLPASLQQRAVEWYHEFLYHPGENRTELTLRQHYDFKGLKPLVAKVCKACNACKLLKKKTGKYGKLPPKEAEINPWHTLCIDLIGPYTLGDKKKGTECTLWCMTMIDPATGWFELVQIPTKRADYIANYLEFSWLTRYPWPTEVVMDRGREFAAEVSAAIKDEYGIHKKLITTRNPQANAMVERAHQTLHNMVRMANIRSSEDLDPRFDFEGLLGACRRAMNSTVHTTLRATPTQLVFGRDALLNVAFQADWEYIKMRKQVRILQNNYNENKTRRDHVYSVDDRVMVELSPNRKHGEPNYEGPYTVTAVNDNGTVQLRKDATNGGAVFQTWNIRQLMPCKA